PYGAALMPLVVGIPAIILSVAQLVIEIRKWRHEVANPVPFDSLPEEEQPEFGMHTAREEFKAWGDFLGTIGGVLAFGFYVTIPIIVTLYLAREAKMKLHWALLSAAVYTGFVYGLFEVGLRFWVFQGLFTNQILRAIGL